MARLRQERNSWGVFSLLVALISTYAIWRIWQSGFGEIVPDRRDQILVLAGLAGALLTGWFGRASYPRVHNFKIYTMAIGMGTVTLMAVVLVFGLSIVSDMTGTGVYPAAIFLAYAAALFVLLVTVVAPEYVSYRVTVRFTTAVVVLIVLGFLLGVSIPFFRLFLVDQLIMLRDVRSTVFWIFSSVALAILLLSVFSETHSLGIGGTHAGAVVLLSLGWMPPDADVLLQGMVLAWMPVLIGLGTLIHWFQRLENRASYDPLLRIYNRGWCEQVLDERSPLDTRPPFGIALIDLDHFKAVNDTHGHDAGDTVLREIAQRIRSAVIPRGSIARYGGEELILFFPSTTEDELRELLEAVRVEVEANPVRHGKIEIPVTCSIGFAVRKENAQPLAEVLRAADKAVYAAKERGRNQVRLGRLL